MVKSVYNKILFISLPLIFFCCGDDFIFQPMEHDNDYYYRLVEGELIEVPITPVKDIIQIKFFSGTTNSEVIDFENQHDLRFFTSHQASNKLRGYKLKSDIDDIVSYAKNLNNIEIIESALPAYLSIESGVVRYIYFEFYVYTISKSWGEDLNKLIDKYPVKIIDYSENNVRWNSPRKRKGKNSCISI